MLATYSIVVSGIKECPKGTSRMDRFKQNINNVANLIQAVDPDFHKQSIHDCFRLGKFKENATRPRSILVKFNRYLDAMFVLSNKPSLPNGIIIKPDMTREERNADSLLLQERWPLIKSAHALFLEIALSATSVCMCVCVYVCVCVCICHQKLLITILAIL